MDDLYAAVGCGGIAAQQVVTRLREEQRAHDKPLVPVLPRVAEPMPLHGGKSTSKEDMGIKIAGLPGCVMYAKATVFDLILPRVAAGVEIERRDIIQMGHGGLCLGCKECHYPVCPFGKEA